MVGQGATPSTSLRARVLVPQGWKEANVRGHKSRLWVTGCQSAHGSFGGLCHTCINSGPGGPVLGSQEPWRTQAKLANRRGKRAFRCPPWAPSPSEARRVETGQVSQAPLSGVCPGRPAHSSPDGLRQQRSLNTPPAQRLDVQAGAGRAGSSRPAPSSRGLQTHLPARLPLRLHLSPHLSGPSLCVHVSSHKDAGQLGSACPKNLISNLATSFDFISEPSYTLRSWG